MATDKTDKKKQAEKLVDRLDEQFNDMILSDNSSTVTVKRLSECLEVPEQAIRDAVREGTLPFAFNHKGLGKQRTATTILKAPLFHWWYQK